MVAAQEGDPEERAGPGSARYGPFASHGPKEKEQNERRPNSAIQHRRPVGGPHKSAQSEGDCGEQRSGARPFQIAAKPVAEQRRLKMNENEIPVQEGLPDPSVA